MVEFPYGYTSLLQGDVESWGAWMIADAGSGRKGLKEKGDEEDWVR